MRGKIKIKFAHTTKGNTWELTVKGKDEDEVIPIIKRADKAMRNFTKEQEVEKVEPPRKAGEDLKTEGEEGLPF